MEHIEQKELERFRSFFEVVGDCYLWKGWLDRDGYGSFFFRRKSRRAHRVAYFMKNGPIPDKMVVDHLCKNRNCVNPEHLRIVTAKENSLENSNSVGAINAAKTHCKNGHPFDRKYGKQRYCSICQAVKTKRLRKIWLVEANKVAC